MSVIYKLNGVDISDDVMQSGLVPFVSRNRDWTITSEGFSFGLSYTNPATVLVGDIIEVYNNSDAEFLGIVERVTNDDTQELDRIQVAHFFKNGITDNLIKPTLLRPFLIDTDDNIKDATINTTTDKITYTVPGGDPAAQNGDFVYFQADTLPTGISNTSQYVVQNQSVASGDVTFEIAELGTAIKIDLTDTGTNVKIGLTDKKKYIQYDSEGLPSCNVKHLIVSLGAMLGFVIDTTNVDDIAMPSNPAGAKLDDLRMDENMMYAINQSFAVNSEYIQTNEDAISKQITAFELLSELFSLFGFYPKYSEPIPKTFILFAIPRSNAIMLLSSDISYTITDANTFSKTSEKVARINDFAVRALRARGDGNDIIRSDYNNSTESPLFLASGTDDNSWKNVYSFSYEFLFGGGGGTQIDPSASVDTLNSFIINDLDLHPNLFDDVTKAQDIPWKNNFWIFQSDEFNSPSGNSYDINPDYDFMVGNTEILKNKVAFYCADWTTENIETVIVDSESRVKENSINPTRQTSVIIQETPSV